MTDQAWLSSQFPFKLVPTNAEGIYTTLPIPDKLKLNSASDSELMHLGLLPHRLTSARHPKIAEFWNNAFNKGLRKIVPNVVLKKPGRRPVKRRGGSSGAQATSPNWCGGVLAGNGGWSFVTGIVTLPYLSAPAQDLQGERPATLSAWVGLDGNPPDESELLQACIGFWLDETTNPPSTAFSDPFFQWWIPDPNDPYSSLPWGSATVTNAPPMQSGDLVQLAVEYLRLDNGDNWGRVTFVFFNYPEFFWLGPSEFEIVPLMIDLLFVGPTAAQAPCKGATAEWILENQAVTDPQPGWSTTVPVFSGSQGANTPILFGQAWADVGVVGYGVGAEAPLGADLINIGGPYGAPSDGFTVLWQDPNNPSQISNAASVNLAPLEVSISYG